MTLYLVRHAHIDEAYAKCYNGHIDINLSDYGVQKAQELGQALQDYDFDAIYCSPLKRAVQTLEAFHLNQEVIYHDALKEKSWGRHEGLNYDTIVSIEKTEYENFDQWLSVLDGEDYDLFIARVRNFFLEYLTRQPYKNVLLVTHAGVIRVLLHLIEKISLESAFSRAIDYADYLKINLKASV